MFTTNISLSQLPCELRTIVSKRIKAYIQY